MKTSEIGRKLSKNSIIRFRMFVKKNPMQETQKNKKAISLILGRMASMAIRESPKIYGFAVRVKQLDINKVKSVFRKCRR